MNDWPRQGLVELGERFRFPDSIEPGSTFTRSSIIALLNREAKEKGIKEVIFKWVFTPSSHNCQQIIVFCKYCKARVLFRNEHNRFVLRYINNLHFHAKFVPKEQIIMDEQSEILSRTMERSQSFQLQLLIQDIEERRQRNSSKPTIQSSETRDSNNHEGSDSTLVDSSRLLDELAICMVASGKVISNNLFPASLTSPKSIMLVAQQRLSLIDRYGAVLAVEMRQLTIAIQAGESRYKLMVFAVGDNNERPIVVAAVIGAQISPCMVAKAVLHIQSITSIRLTTILTRSLPEMDEMVQKVVAGLGRSINHVYDIQAIEEQLNSSLLNLHFTATSIERAVSHFMEAVKLRERPLYQQKLGKLRDDPKVQAALDSFIKNKQKVFFCEMGKHFFGLHRTLCSQLAHLLNHKLGLETVQATHLSKIFDDSAISSIKCIPKTSNTQCMGSKDRRLCLVLEKFEERPAKRFMENYNRAITSCCLVSKENIVKHSKKAELMAVVQDGSGRQKHQIRNWKCGCGELQKTGVPCCHIIYLVRQTKNKRYCKLISPRWLKRSSDGPEQS